jgi:hypothetical protein
MDNELQPPTIRIVLDEAVAQGEYVNFANIIHSPSEFVIDLGRVVPGRNDVKIYSRVIMTPLHAKQLLEALATTSASSSRSSARSAATPPRRSRRTNRRTSLGLDQRSSAPAWPAASARSRSRNAVTPSICTRCVP